MRKMTKPHSCQLYAAAKHDSGGHSGTPLKLAFDQTRSKFIAASSLTVGPNYIAITPFVITPLEGF